MMSVSSIYKKLLEVQINLNAPKSQYNSFGKYSYRNCEDILEAVKPLLMQNHLILKIDDTVEKIGDRFYIKSTVTLTDIDTCESISNTAYAREEESKKGMDESQITGASSSYARKYALNGMFCIDDNKDSDSTNRYSHDKKCTTSFSSNRINDNQIKRLYTIANNAGYDVEAINSMVKKKFDKEIKDLTKTEYERVCNGLERNKNA